MKGSPWHALWTFPAVLLSAFFMAWAAEAAQFLISQGLALALLAWLQTLPEFAVEAVIAWSAGKDPALTHLVIANFTGAIRLLIGLGFPMVGLICAISRWRKGGSFFEAIRLEPKHTVEVWFMLVPMLYFLWIYAKGTLTLLDGFFLILLYIGYLAILLKLPKEELENIEEIPSVSRWVLKPPGTFKKWVRTIGLFLLGGGGIMLLAHPFVESMLSVALAFGISEFYFVQWVAPFLSEFPEKVSAFNWARQGKKAPMGLMNFVASNINQWSVLPGIIPFIFCLSLGYIAPIPLDHLQRQEILLTFAQSLYAFVCLLDMRFSVVESFLLFGLWFYQFIFPSGHTIVTYAYFGVTLGVMGQLFFTRKLGKSTEELRKVLNKYVLA